MAQPSLLQCWRTISQKLGITEEQVVVIHCFHRGCVNELGRRKMIATLNEVVERFGLDDSDWTPYGAQLAAKKVLTIEEALLFTQGVFHAERTPEEETEAADTIPAIED